MKFIWDFMRKIARHVTSPECSLHRLVRRDGEFKTTVHEVIEAVQKYRDDGSI